MDQLYVDDYLGGADKVEIAKTRVNETNTLFREARLNMRRMFQQHGHFYGRLDILVRWYNWWWEGVVGSSICRLD